MVVVQVRESLINSIKLPHALSGCDNDTVALGRKITVHTTNIRRLTQCIITHKVHTIG